MTRHADLSAAKFSLAEARGIVSDLFTPRPALYWCDFLASILIGHLAFAVTRWLYDIHWQPLWLRLLVQAATFSVQCGCYYRAAMFVHEIVHLPRQQFRVFRLVWNLLCGIPFLVPTFAYEPHLEHHRRASFGTSHDGEYLPLANLPRWYIALYLSQCLWMPPLAAIRFGLLTPLGWVCPPLRAWVDQRASSLVMDLRYCRERPTGEALWEMQWQEVACFLFLLSCVIVPSALDRPLAVLAIHGYLTSVVLILLNSLRTIAGHRFMSEGHETTFVGQLLDSVTLDSDSPLAILLHPVGLRYHATHHLFPGLPYHNLRAAHRRLMEQLPADSPYRQTVEHSLLAAIATLWRRAACSHRQPRSMLLAPRQPHVAPEGQVSPL